MLKFTKIRYLLLTAILVFPFYSSAGKQAVAMSSANKLAHSADDLLNTCSNETINPYQSITAFSTKSFQGVVVMEPTIDQTFGDRKAYICIYSQQTGKVEKSDYIYVANHNEPSPEKSATFVIDGETHRFNNGESVVDIPNSSSQERAVILDEPKYFADINNDGKEDAVVIITLNTGGSGQFYYLGVVYDIRSAYHAIYSEPIYLGDRIKVTDIVHSEMDTSKISVGIVTRKDDQPFSVEPSEQEYITFDVDKGYQPKPYQQ